MKILIVGNMGYIGPIVVNHLRTTLPGCQLIGFDTGFFAGCLIEPGSYPETLLDQQWIGDVRHFPAELLSGAHAVVQLAAISNDPMGNAFETPTMQINCDSAVTIAKMAKAAGVSNFVFASSCSVYGAGGDGAKNETSELAPQTAYARSKIHAERRLEDLATEDFRVTCLRFATACGWSPRLRLDLVLNDFVASAITSSKITILSDGSPWRPLIHVRDMARAIEWACSRKVSDGGQSVVVNAGSDEWNFQVRDLARAVGEQIGGVDISINSAAAPDRRSYRVDFGLFRRLAPQHQPLVTVAEAVRELGDGLRRSRFSEPDFRQSRWIRLRVLSDLVASNRVDSALFRVNAP